MTPSLWIDRTPSHRCDWIDQLRGWAVLVMIEVHCTNLWLELKLRPEWLNYINGLVAPSFLMAAGFSLVLSTFRPDGALRPFHESGRRYAFILVCAYLLHSPGLTLAEWTVLATPQKFRELFKIDVLQCTIFSLLLLQGLARVIRNPRGFALAALGLAIYIPLLSPYLWAEGVVNGFWLPLRGVFNGNVDRGVQALFPLFPWLSFVAFGAFLGGLYRYLRVETTQGRARLGEARFLAGLFILGLAMWFWGNGHKKEWIWGGTWFQDGFGVWRLNGFTWNELQRIYNTTLPSVFDRLGWICMAGAALGAIELKRPQLPGFNVVQSTSRESLLLYMAHLNLLFGVLMAAPIVAFTGLEWNSRGWPTVILLTSLVVAANLALGVWWQTMRRDHERMRRTQRRALAILGIWAVFGGWWTFRHFLQSPELAKEPYPFLNAARARKGLPPTPDGLPVNPEEVQRERERLAHHGEKGSSSKK